MKKLFTFLLLLCVFVGAFAQWSPTTMQGERLRDASGKEEFFKLDINQLRAQLKNAEESGAYAKAVEISIPLLSGKIERFKVYSAPVMVRELADQYQLGSYAGVGVDDPSKFIRFSLAPNDFQSMIIGTSGYEFIEPANKDKTVYRVFPKSKPTGGKAFECTTSEKALSKDEIAALYSKGKSFNHNASDFAKNSDKKYRTLRLALSVTGEYTAYFGGVAGAMTAINATLTRVNGVFEKDFALRLNLQNYPTLIYTNAATDPYSPSAQMNNWGVQLQQTLTSVVGNANYDIGHLFGATGGGGNAGCIGCICVNPTSATDTKKGSAYTSPSNGIPQGDTFDIDYVAHEFGHQLGGNHTFSHNLEGSGVNVEPGSGSSIMGYAGITGAATDVQAHSDPYFHTASINQIQTNLIAKTCDVENPITNNPPVIAALTPYSIPKGTAFVLTGSATDPENNPMTYVWEEMDDSAVSINATNLGNTSTGASFRSVAPTATGNVRYFPKFASVLAGVLNNSNNQWEAVSTVARTQNFAFTVRDNNPTANEQQTSTANQVVNVGNDGPFKVTSTTVYNNSAGAILWDVANTNAAPYNSPNVKIDYTTNNGATWTVISNSTANDGAENFQFTGLATGSNVKIRISSIGNIFYAIGSATVAAMQNCSTAAPTGVAVSGVTMNSANVTWNPATGATYNLQYKKVSDPTWTQVNGLTVNSYIIPNLAEGTQYEVQVTYVCSGTPGSYSASVNFTTLNLAYCPATSQNFADEWISNVTVTPTGAAVMNNNSAGSTYTDYTADPSKLVNLVIGSANNQLSVSKAWSGTQYNEGVSVWIDFNRNSTFEANEKVMDAPANMTTPVTATFTVPAGSYNGPLNTRMRVILTYSNTAGSPSPNDPCATFQYGEVEDYAVKLLSATPSCNAPSGLAVAGVTAVGATISWTATTPVPANGYDYYISTTNTPPTAATVPTGNTTTTSVNLTNLTANTTYYWWVRSVCSAADSSAWLAGASFTTLSTAVALPYNQPFTGPNDFIFVNGTQTNKWVYGSATGNPANSIYVSNDNGVTNSYANTSSSVVQAYKDFIIPAGTTNATLFFDWKSLGESNWDYLRVWMVPATFVPTAGTQITAGGGRIQIGGNFQAQNTWQTYFNPTLNLSSFAGSNMRLVFEWRNDGSGGTNPPAAIDNINLSIPTCQVPTALTFSTVTNTTATISWTAANPVPGSGYQYYYSTNNTPPTATTTPTGSVTTTSAPLTGLSPNTVYYFWVRSNCGAGGTSFWVSGGSFTTGQIPATLPYIQPFTTGPVDFTFVNGNQTNKWFWGSATGNPANSIYITNDNGVTNTYTTSTSTSNVVQAYRDFTIPAGTTNATLFFDWKSVGEGGWDYLRVWMVPVSFVPTAGTQITAGGGRIQIGGNFELQSAWQTYFNPTVNLSSFAGSTMRLVFEWRNDTGGGTNPPAAVDNINLSIPTCQVPTALTFSAITSNSATISWTAASPAPGSGYQYYYSTTNTPPTATTTPSGSVTATSALLTGLSPNTTYYFWVRSNCGAGGTSYWMFGGSFTTGQIPATLPYIQPFTTGPVDFTFVNGNQTNKWFWGSAAGNPANSIYITNDNGVTNAYTISTSTNNVVQAYRDFIIPAGTTNATLFFDWKSFGENNWDYLRVWMVPVSFVPTAGTQITAGGGRIQIGGNFQLQDTWQTYFNPTVNLSSFAGNTMRLVFEWRNDTIGGTNPPAAVDNINLSIPTCQVPTALTFSAVTSTSATISWTAANPVPGNGYQYYYSTNNTPPTATTIPSGSVTATSAPLTGLSPNTTYYFWVRSNCGAGGTSFWMPGGSFTTGQIPATMPYVQPFTTGPVDFTFVNGSQTNKWAYGTATGNPANAIYISNDNGTTNAYATTSSSVVHAYRDIAIPSGTNLVIFAFDWKSVGESNWDYLRVWLVPVSFVPTPGTQITAGAGRVQVGTNYQTQSAWQSYNNPAFDLTAFAGQTMRLVFEWRNDASGGTNPPAAVDNIRLVRCSTQPPVLTVNNITHNSATVTWPQDPGGASYIIRYRPIGANAWTATIPVAAVAFPNNTNSYQLNGLSPVVQYEVEVSAVCQNTAGSYAHIEFETKCDPAPPTNFVVTQITATSAMVSWSPVLSAVYTIRYREVGSGTWITINNIAGTSQALTNLLPYTTYEVQVASICSGATNPYTTPAVFTTLPTCQMAPIGLTVTNITMTQAQVDWNAFAGATYVLKWRKVGHPTWNTLNLNTNTYLLTGLTEQTQYEIQVANVCNGTVQTFTVPYVFTTPAVVYCDMSSTNSQAEHISNVKVSTAGQVIMNNDSGASNYTSYANVPTKVITLVQGSSNNEISVTKKWTGTQYNEAVTVWLDFNRDGIFANNERILVSAPSTSTPVTATFSVPANSFTSLTPDKYVVMRVAMKRGSAPAMCSNFDNGEVEDYKVLILKPMSGNFMDPNQITVYPNPAKHTLFVTVVADGSKYTLYNSVGQLVKKGIIIGNKIDVSSLINGIYVVDIEAQEGKKAQIKFIKE